MLVTDAFKGTAAGAMLAQAKVYLGRHGIDLITDHRALQWLDTLYINDRKGRRARWLEYLQEFDITSRQSTRVGRVLNCRSQTSYQCQGKS